ncbi:MAG TPA: LuxR C-terminal-related transcriptional regulator [Anaerolineaceae bacterium]|nr:LuxR C-terminal-related transcriptional regulator [Anaerolineaceae bacterium]
MKLALLASKTFLPPTPAYLVPRPRLEQRLDDALLNHHRLILVSAPPGSGKSSLLAEWAARQMARLAWVSLEAGDNDPLRFWSYFLAAVQKSFPQAAEMLADLATAPALPPTLVSDLVNLLCTGAEPVVVALDDYHLIENEEIQQGLQYLIEHLPPQVCLAITTRVDPALPLHRWRARGQVTEIRAADLRFTLEEASRFLTGSMRLELEPAEVRKLEERTEGWATGLQLAALALQTLQDGDPGAFIEQFSGSQRFVLEYLMNEVFARQPAAVQQFLLRTSILESMCVELCDVLVENGEQRTENSITSVSVLPVPVLHRTGRSLLSSFSILDYLISSNLFLVPLDEEHAWFRYQHLFADFLRQRLKRQGEETVRDLHQRAAEWYAGQAMVEEALRHALAANNLPFAREIIGRYCLPVASEGRMRVVVGWLEMLPREELARDPRLSLVYAWMLVSIGRMNSVEEHIRNADQVLLSVESGLDEQRRSSLVAQLAALKAMQAARKGDLASTQRFVREATQVSTPLDALVLGLARLAEAILLRELGNFPEAVATFEVAVPMLPTTGVIAGYWVAVVYLGQSYLVQGRLSAAEELYRARLRRAGEEGLERAPGIAVLQVGMGLLEYEKNHLAEARALFEKGEANSRRSGMVDARTATALLGAQLDRLDGKIDQGIARLGESLDAVRNAGSANLSAELSAWLARFQAEAGQLNEAEAWARRIQPCPQKNPNYTRGVELFCLARVLLALGRYEEAHDLAEQLAALAAAGGCQGRAIEAGMLAAQSLWRQSLKTEAAQRLAGILDLASQCGFARLFLDEGEEMRLLIADCLSWLTGQGRVKIEKPDEDFVRYSDELLKSFPIVSEEYSINNQPLACPAPLAYPPRQARSQGPWGLGSVQVSAIYNLTSRELEVLNLLSEGLSYPQIAARLVVSTGTVKTHASHIYAKLEVEGRVEAIRRARQLKILKD